eukprot:170468_1
MSNWLCGEDPLDFFDNGIFDVAECYRELFFYGFPFLFISLVGSLHLLRTLRRPKRFIVGTFHTRLAEWWIYGLSLLLVVFPWNLLLAQDNWKLRGAQALIAPGIRSVSWLFSALVFRVETTHNGFSPTFALYGFWTLEYVADIARLRSAIQHAVTDGTDSVDVFVFVGFALSSALWWVAVCMKRRASELERWLGRVERDGKVEKNQKLKDAGPVKETKREVNHESTASLLSVLTFSWMTPLFVSGYRKQIEFENFDLLMNKHRARTLSLKFSRAWEKQKEHARVRKSTLTQWSLMSALSSAHGKIFYQAGFMKRLSDSLMFSGVKLLNELIRFAENKTAPLWQGYAIAAAMFVLAMLTTFILHQYFQRVFRTGMYLKTSLVSAVYSKSLRLSGTSRQEKTTGEIVNLMATDSQRINDLFPYIHMLWSAPLQICLAVLMLYQQVGPSVFVGLFVMLALMLPVNAAVMKRLQSVQKRIMGIKDKRVKVTNEVLASMKVIKLYAWENSFKAKITQIRQTELKDLKTFVILRTMMSVFWGSTTILVALSTFAAYTLLGNELTPTTAFTALALFNLLRFPVQFFPMVITQAIEAGVSFQRLVDFLNAPEIRPTVCSESGAVGDCAVSVEHADFYWDDACSANALTDVNYAVKRGQLAMIVGRVGSGKSALLSALTGDLVQNSGTISVDGAVAYASQTAWIQNASVRDNILFGSDYDRRWYRKVIFACALQPDLDVLPAGDKTEIGEKGINLSGGQKQRVALARAVYRRTPIYLLDDTLSAVDAHVGKHIMEHCILGLLRDATVIFATNSIHFLEKADHVAVLESGTITHQGTYAELTRSELDLARLLKPAEEEEEKEKVKEEKK